MAKALAIRDPREISVGGCHLKRTGIVFENGATFDHWHNAGLLIEQCDGAVQWWIGDWLLYGEGRPDWGDKYEQAISLFNRPYETLAQYKSVARQYQFCDRSQNLPWAAHLAVAYEPPKVRAKLLKEAEPDAPDKPPRLSVAELRAKVRQRKRAEVLQDMIDAPLPKGKFRLIYADPPWQYDFSATETRAIENHYPTMPVDDICALPISDLAADDCLLLLWGTNPKLREALKVIEAWGFEYKTNAVWVKHAIGMGYYFRQRHELLIVATRGNVPVPDPDVRPDSVIESNRRAHSEKPPEVYDLIDAMFPAFVGKKHRVELFQRKARAEWSAWGNEVQDAQ